jgi:hypothetical protein
MRPVTIIMSAAIMRSGFSGAAGVVTLTGDPLMAGAAPRSCLLRIRRNSRRSWRARTRGRRGGWQKPQRQNGAETYSTWEVPVDHGGAHC